MTTLAAMPINAAEERARIELAAMIAAAADALAPGAGDRKDLLRTGQRWALTCADVRGSWRAALDCWLRQDDAIRRSILEGATAFDRDAEPLGRERTREAIELMDATLLGKLDEDDVPKGALLARYAALHEKRFGGREFPPYRGGRW